MAVNIKHQIDSTRQDCILRRLLSTVIVLHRQGMKQVTAGARWQSGYAAACKAVDAGSIPTLASIFFPWVFARLSIGLGSGMLCDRCVIDPRVVT